jgi:hypothetical protein
MALMSWCGQFFSTRVVDSVGLVIVDDVLQAYFFFFLSPLCAQNVAALDAERSKEEYPLLFIEP